MNTTAAQVRLAGWRKQEKLSQWAAGELCGVAQPTYRCWERGENQPRTDQLMGVRHGTNGIVHPIDFMRPPAPEDEDLSLDVSHLREQAAQQPAAGAA